MNSTPPMRDDEITARGMFRRASLVSSASVVTASKPRNEYAAIAAAAETPATVVSEFQNGAVYDATRLPAGT